MVAFSRRDFLGMLGIGFGAFCIPSADGGRLVSAVENSAKRPNIILILADDMGYGDPRCFNENSRIPTPGIDRLAKEGMKFTDAHAPIGLCVPSRYSLMTGRYPFRAEKYNLRDRETTVASVLKSAGYHTAMVGKWHLGFRYPKGQKGAHDVRPDEPLRNGPVDRGFDYFFGIPASLDIAPYYYIENDRIVEGPSNKTEEHHSPGVRDIQGAFWRAGGVAPGFRHEEVLSKVCDKSLAVLEEHKKNSGDKPLFLYLALPAPHTPWLPSAKYRGISKAGDYGDYVAQVDGVVGQVLERLDALDMTRDTLVMFTSDNGPVWYSEDVVKYGHASVGPLRGMKADVLEGGHRMPFVVRWPGQVKAGSVSGETICFTDMMATFAEISKATLAEDAGVDSISILPVMLGRNQTTPVREVLILQSGNGLFSIRRGRWKLIMGPGSGGFSQSGEASGGVKIQLYDMQADISERNNLCKDKPEMVAELTALLEKQRKSDRTAPERT